VIIGGDKNVPRDGSTQRHTEDPDKEYGFVHGFCWLCLMAATLAAAPD
jgi:hypothetical protein